MSQQNIFKFFQPKPYVRPQNQSVVLEIAADQSTEETRYFAAMGIPSLTSFVDENPRLLSAVKLRNTRVVIDGNNLYHFCYAYFKFNHQHGGDYDAFADRVRFYFSSLTSCGIEPYVVFDGGYDADDRKRRTLFQRAKDRLHNAARLAAGQRVTICPILVYETFVQVLDELNISHVTCDFEADREIAALAKEWNCPVMSNDSDFFIYDLPAGFILFDYLNIAVKTHKVENQKDKQEEEYMYMDAQVYYVNNLLAFVPGMDRNCLALFATLMGNDCVNPDNFASFFSHRTFSRHRKSNFKTSKRHERMIALLHWLESAKSLDNAMSRFLAIINQQKKLENLVRMVIDSYTNLTSSLSDYFNTTKESIPASQVQTKSKQTLPNWFISEVRRSRIHPNALNTLIHRRVVLLSQIELMSVESAYNCASSLRQVFYAILLSLDSNSADTAAVMEYTRLGKHLNKNSVEGKGMLEDGTSVPGLSDIPDLSAEERVLFLKKCCGDYDLNIQNLDDCYQLAVWIIPYWIRNSSPKIHVLYLYALIVTFIKVAVVDKRSRGGAPKKTVTLKAISGAETRKEAYKNIDRVCQRHDGNDMHCIHAFSQYQSCVKAVMQLNSLLLQPITQIEPGLLLNGTCFYSVSKELMQRKNPKQYVEELLIRDSPLALFFNGVLESVLAAVPEDALVVDTAVGKKNAKKSKEKKKAAKTPPPTKYDEEKDDKSVSDTSDTDSGENIVAACALGNKFAMLTFSDD